nr:tenascin N [Hymenolepis microstoma]
MRCLFYLLITFLVATVQSQDKTWTTSNVQSSAPTDAISQLDPPQNIQLRFVGNTSALLSWDALDHSGVELAEYLVYYSIDYSKWNDKITTECEVILPFGKEHLDASVIGVYKLNDGTNHTKNGRVSRTARLTKYPPEHDPPRNVQLRQVNNTSALLTWDPIEIPGLFVKGYLVYFIDDDSEWKEITTTESAITLTIKNKPLYALVTDIYQLYNGSSNIKQVKRICFIEW